MCPQVLPEAANAVRYCYSKTFRNLDIKKNVRLTLNDTKEGFIKGINKEVTIS